jgi:mandelate racemase
MSMAGPDTSLTLRKVQTRGVRVPLKFVLGTSAAVVTKVPLLLIDLATEQGLTGRAYLFCYTPSGARAVAGHIHEAVDLVKGRPTTPIDLMQTLHRRFALLGVTGTVRMALSALDMALWDAMAQAADRPLAALLGASLQPLPAYDSRGLGLMEDAKLADEAERLLEKGMKAVKLRLGHESLAQDMAALEAVRRRIGTGVEIMVDYNQALTTVEAMKRCQALEEHGLSWIEEPIAHEDYRSYARLAREIQTPIQIGENFNGPEGALDAIKAEACDLVMPDVARIGGVTGWMSAAGIAAAAGIPMSSHLMPEISAQLLCATPTRHWLEYVDWAEAFLQEPLRIVDGMAVPSAASGSGLQWDEERLARLEQL